MLPASRTEYSTTSLSGRLFRRASLALLALVCFALRLPAQTPPGGRTSLSGALLGHWTGVLEYRDYAEPATSTKRVQLPTWLYIHSQGEALRFEYTYDDGPNKVVKSSPTVLIDEAAETYKVVPADGVAESYTVSGLATLRNAHGTLILTGEGTDNKKPAQIRTTLVVGRNLLSWLEEVRPAGSTEPFVFRHRYTFTRAEAPAPTP